MMSTVVYFIIAHETKFGKKIFTKLYRLYKGLIK